MDSTSLYRPRFARARDPFRLPSYICSLRMSDLPANRPPAAASGILAKTPPVHLLLYGLEKELTGTVEFSSNGEPRATLLFVGGRPAKARTIEPISYLGRVLLELGYLSEDDLTRSLGDLAQAKKGKGTALHGQLLLASRTITAAQLEAGLGEQLARTMRYVASLPPEATYDYYDGFDGLTGWGMDATQGFDPIPMIWGMLRESPPRAHVNAALDRVAAAPLRIARGATLARLGLGEAHRRLAELLSSRPLRFSDLVAASGDVGEQETRLLLYLLLVTKQVDLLRPVESAAQVPVAAPAAAPAPALRSPPPPAPVQVAPPRSPVPPAPRRTPPPARYPTSSETFAASAVTPSPPTPIVTTPSPPAGKPSSQPPGLSRELIERWNDIRERAATIDKTDYFMMLGLTRDAKQEDVESAFYALAKKWHPDRLPLELSAVRIECSRVFARMSEAHVTLADAEQRSRYMQLLAEGSGSPETRDSVLKVVEAATNFQKAEVCLRRHDLAQAEVLCRKAVEADPTQSDYLAMLAWLTALKAENQTPERTRESIQMLDRAIELNGRCEKAHFWRGMLHKRLGKSDTAFRDFKAAVELNPRNIDAAREVRLHRMRRGGRSSSPPPPAGRSMPPSGRSTPPLSGRPASNPAKPDDGKPGLLGRLFGGRPTPPPLGFVYERLKVARAPVLSQRSRAKGETEQDPSSRDVPAWELEGMHAIPST